MRGGPEPTASGSCVVFGSHHQVCGEEAFDLGGVDAEAFPFYACLEGATCGPGASGRCGWQTTPAADECLRNSEPPAGRIPHADFHVHWDHPEQTTPGIYAPYESLATIDAMGITTGMLITNTYKAYLTPNMTVDELVAINQRYSEILSSHPHGSKYQILCGVSFERDDAAAFAARCLELPKVRGIKLRNFTVRRAEDLQKLESLLKLANERRALVLSHFGAPEGPPGGDDGGPAGMEDTQEIVSIMDGLPNATLVIAHSGRSSFVGRPQLEWIGQHYRDNPSSVRNIYIETSSSFARTEDGKPREDAEAWVRSWRSFGLERVVFGSDYAAQVVFFRDTPLKWLSSTSELSPSEAENITRLTGERLAVSPASR